MRRDALDRYNEMRDFHVTDEPSGEVKRTNTGRSFVIQKHDATRLHYDFRLELDGVLLSWAVPKGPSLSPKDKRLAVQTEDHPVDYRDFEGTIPHGQYGGGPVIVWDRGTWTPIGDPRAGMKKGRLELELDGEKLHGRWLLVRLANGRDKKKNTWLLIKRSDEHVREGKDAEIVERRPESAITGRTIADIVAGVSARPPKKTNAKRTRTKSKSRTRTRTKLISAGSLTPQLATLVDDVPTVGDWVYEIKYDGYRILAWLDDGKVTLWSRNGKEWTKNFPHVVRALSRVRAKNAIFDGEVAYVMEDGKTDFQMLQNALGGEADAGRLVYFAFDLLWYDGDDLRDEPLRDRKEKLRTIFAGEGPPLKMSDHVEENGVRFFDAACKAGLEGIIAKRGDRPYRKGRSPEWVKVKCQKRQELVVVGFTPPKGARKGLGALLLGVKDGKDLRYAGKVGTGFTHASLDDLVKRLTKLRVETPPIVNPPKMKDVTWARPELVAQIRFTEWTRDGSLRHPSFEGLREDKKASRVVREVEKPVETVEDEIDDTRGVKVSHPERVLDPKSGMTKLDLARYYAAVADKMLPYMVKRPLMLMRCPEGNTRKGACFVQKHSGRGLQGLKRIHKGDVEGEEVLYVTEPAAIVELAQFNVIELHGWGCRMPKWQKPDWIVFDFDPDEGLAFSKVVDAAREMRDALAKMKLVSFVKTTGGKGLHVVVPLSPKHDWDTVRNFAEAMAEAFVKAAPSRYIATMSKKARKGKIFVDWLRNAKGATAILPYSVRARPGSPVAMPIAWTDLERLDPQELTVETVPKILAKLRKDPWADLLSTEQVLPKI